MKKISRTAVAVSTALAVSMGATVASADPLDTGKEILSKVEKEVEKGKLQKKLKDDPGAAPQTDSVLNTAKGSIDSDMTADQAYSATQAGWGILWAAVAALGLGALYQAAVQAGLIR